MFKFSKYISVILHPILLPTLATIIFFIISPIDFDKRQIYFLVSFVFLTSYILPLFLLIFFKKNKLISNFDIRTTHERKIPLITFIVISLIQSVIIYNIPYLKILGILFWGGLLALIIAYLLIFLNFRTSLHLIGISGFTTYFIILSLYFNSNLTFLITPFIFLIGLLATARLIVKAHTPLELFVGFICGSGSVILATHLFIN